MANIKISELNELSKVDRTDILPIVDVSANETKKVLVDNLIEKNIELLAISDTAPSEFEDGDKYYNTSTKKIYTAIDESWSETGETPLDGLFYIVFNEQSSYAWNGSDLVSVGGGKEDIVISDTEPTDPDVKLWIDTGEVQNLGSELHVGSEINSKVRTNIIKGKNLFDKDNANIIYGSFSSTDAISTYNVNAKSVYISCKPNTTYTISKSNATNRFRAGTTNVIPAPSVNVSGVITNDNGTIITITTNSNAKYLIIYYWVNTDTSDNVLNSLQIEVGSTATTYKTYITPTINVDGEDIYVKGQNEEYSLSEKRIGTWIDGKPLYRIMIPATVNSNTEGTISLITSGVPNPDTIIINVGKSVSHYNTSVVGGAYNNPNYYSSTTDYGNLYIDVNKVLHIKNTSGTQRQYYICIEYTKTTD